MSRAGWRAAFAPGRVPKLARISGCWKSCNIPEILQTDRGPYNGPMARNDAPLLNVRELAQWLRLKERKVYDLVARNEIPHTRAASQRSPPPPHPP